MVIKKAIIYLCILISFSEMLLAQQVNVSAGKDNTVYLSTTNRIKIQPINCDCASLMVRSDNGKIKKEGECLYSLIPLRTGIANIDVSLVNNKKIGIFPIQVLPRNATSGNGATTPYRDEPIVKYDSPSKLPKGTLKAHIKSTFKPTISKYVIGDAFKLSLGFVNGFDVPDEDILSYTVFILRNDVMYFRSNNQGAAFKQSIIDEFNLVQVGDKILVTNIIYKLRGSTFKMQDLNYQITQ